MATKTDPKTGLPIPETGDSTTTSVASPKPGAYVPPPVPQFETKETTSFMQPTETVIAWNAQPSTSMIGNNRSTDPLLTGTRRWTPTGEMEINKILTDAERNLTETPTGGTGATVVVIPSTLVSYYSSKKASQAEAEAGTEDGKYVTPLKLQNKINYTRASDADVLANTNAIKFITPYHYSLRGIVTSANLKQSADTERSWASPLNAEKNGKEIAISRWYETGTVSVSFKIRGQNINNAEWRIYVNGVAVGTVRNTTSTSYVEFTETITVNGGDLVQLLVKPNDGSRSVWYKDFRISYDEAPIAKTPTVTLN